MIRDRLRIAVERGPKGKNWKDDCGALVSVWPGTGEVGTTHGKESGNAEITKVI